MQRLEVSGAVRPIYGSLGVKRLRKCADVSLPTLLPSSKPATDRNYKQAKDRLTDRRTLFVHK